MERSIVQVIPSKSFRRLVCFQCKKPLSRFPIYTHTKRGDFICGRCTNLNDLAEYVHSWAYEELASYNKFNCCYQLEGCTKLLLPEQVKNHEKYCSYRKYDCPLGKELCLWKGFYDEHLNHFKQNHELFTLDGRSLEVDFKSNHKEKYLLSFDEEMFVVSKEINSNLKTLNCTVRYIERNCDTKHFSYMVEFSTSDIKCSLRTFQDIDQTYEIGKVDLEKILQNLDGLLLRIEVINKKEEKDVNIDDSNTEKPYECPACLERLLPPIYLCTTGHSICEGCKGKVSQCPSCKAQFQGARNFALEDIVLMKTMPCRNLPCTLSGKGSTIQEHQKECVHRTSQCPFFDRSTSPCNKSMPLVEIDNHVTDEHSDSVLEFENAEGSVRLTFKEIHVLKYMSRLFRLVMWQSSKQTYNNSNSSYYGGNNSTTTNHWSWCLQLIGNRDHCKNFKFVVDINNTKGQSICMQGPCVQMMSKNVCSQDAKYHLSIYEIDVSNYHNIRIVEI